MNQQFMLAGGDLRGGCPNVAPLRLPRQIFELQGCARQTGGILADHEEGDAA